MRTETHTKQAATVRGTRCAPTAAHPGAPPARRPAARLEGARPSLRVGMGWRKQAPACKPREVVAVGELRGEFLRCPALRCAQAPREGGRGAGQGS